MPRYCSRCSGVYCRRCYSRLLCPIPMGPPCTTCGPSPGNQNVDTKNIQENFNQILAKYYALCSKVSECINKGYATYQDMTYEDKEQFCREVAPLIGCDSKPINCMKDFLAKRNNPCICSKKNESTSTLDDKCKLQDFLGTKDCPCPSLTDDGDGHKENACNCSQNSKGTVKSQDCPNMKDCLCSKDENDRQICSDVAPLLRTVKPEQRSKFQSAFEEFKNSPAPVEVNDEEFYQMMMDEYKSLPPEKKILFRGFVSGFLYKTKVEERKSSSKKVSKYSETEAPCNAIIIETSETVNVNYGLNSAPLKSSIKKEETEEVMEQEMGKSTVSELKNEKKPSGGEGQEAPKTEVSFAQPSTNPFDEPEPTPSICTGSVKSLCTGSIRSGTGSMNAGSMNAGSPNAGSVNDVAMDADAMNTGSVEGSISITESGKNNKSKKDKKKRLFF